MQIPILTDIVIILGFSVVIILLFQRLRLPSILGFLLTGIIVGPHALSLIHAKHEVELLSEIGVIFLLFIIGVEFSLKGLTSIRNTVFFGGLIQVGATIGFIAAIGYGMGLETNAAIFLGFLFALSSTAIVLKLLQERGELSAPHGRVAIAILIFQDIVVVPMMLFVPILAGEADNIFMTIAGLVAKVIGVVVCVILLAKFIVPYLFKRVVMTKNRELFLVTVIVLCFAVAWLTSSIGLSLALGAFFAGLVVSDSEYSHMATANILPFREIFLSFFFVSIGMLLDLQFFGTHVITIVLLALGVMILKAIIIVLAILILGYPPRTALMSSLSMFQVGEFALLLSITGMEYNLLSEEGYQYFLAISILSMGVTPFVMQSASRITDSLVKAPLPARIRRRLQSMSKVKQMHAPAEMTLRDHLVIIGYGINGENLARAAHNTDIPYVVVELDPDAIERAKQNGEPVIYGDATEHSILQHIHIHEARVVVIAISDPIATKKIVRMVRSFTLTAHIIVRTRHLKEIDENLKLGADEVIPEEFETSIEIFTRVLKHYLIPAGEIQSLTHLIRSRNYEMLREPTGVTARDGAAVHIPEMEIAALRVVQGNNRIIGKPLSQSGLRSEFNVTVLAIKRGNKYITQVSPETTIEQDDLVYLFGDPNAIVKLNKYLRV